MESSHMVGSPNLSKLTDRIARRCGAPAAGEEPDPGRPETSSKPVSQWGAFAGRACGVEVLQAIGIVLEHRDRPEAVDAGREAEDHGLAVVVAEHATADLTSVW
jgi:hypothetical protein